MVGVSHSIVSGGVGGVIVGGDGVAAAHRDAGGDGAAKTMHRSRQTRNVLPTKTKTHETVKISMGSWSAYMRQFDSRWEHLDPPAYTTWRFMQPYSNLM